MPRWASAIGEWSMLLPLWRRLFKAQWQRIAASAATGGLWILIIVATASGGGDEDNNDGSVRSDRTSTPSPATGDQPTSAPTLAPTPAPTKVSTPEPTATPAPQPVVLQGTGQTATAAVTPPSVISVVKFTHDGSSNFIVHTFVGTEEDFLVNTIGQYEGSRPLFGNEPIIFDIDADGSWTITIEPVSLTDSAAFTGIADSVSGLFDPPAPGAWEFSHDGDSNFVVWLHCAGGSDLVQNEIGVVVGSGIFAFEDGPCLWEVEADGNWSLAPRS